MSAIELQQLSTGEPAYGIGKVVYALFAKGDEFLILDAYNPMEREASTFAAKNFTESFANKVKNQAEFISFLRERQVHHEQKIALGRSNEQCSTSTPWGKADGVERYVKGLNFYSTPGHGGFKVAGRLNARIPDALRNSDGWYEEDSEWAKVAFALPEFFTDREKKNALETLIGWYPDEYEAITGTVIEEGVSYKKDERLFKERNVDNWVVISASYSREHEGMTEVIATKGGERGAWDKPAPEEKRFLVPTTDYNMVPLEGDRSRRFGFVVDPAKYEELSANRTPSL